MWQLRDKEIGLFFKVFGSRRTKIKKVLICGGGSVSYYLALQLCGLGMQVKIIELNKKRTVKSFFIEVTYERTLYSHTVLQTKMQVL